MCPLSAERFHELLDPLADKLESPLVLPMLL